MIVQLMQQEPKNKVIKSTYIVKSLTHKAVKHNYTNA